MPVFLVTGRSGAGKTTVCKELGARGYTALDTDRIPDLAQWIDPRTGKPTTVDYGKMINKQAAQWIWDEKVLRRVIGGTGTLFLCGSADNQFAFHPVFSKVFVLTLPPDLQRQRLATRTEHDYGKLLSMQTQIIDEQRVFVRDATAGGAIEIDSSANVAQIVDHILEFV